MKKETESSKYRIFYRKTDSLLVIIETETVVRGSGELFRLLDEV
ncbi:uncharacterized protein RSE6_14151 [Rhynchosporium secalis]|uniref:Uncharacterized protein n=1 Tax=Rhynchosporium secalis TaxID=38038 RepID=A0A1E1MUP5_RHYSE|nr:uncharacterized protein RSE6_14151 [Rhynchosporium secalis]